MHDATDDMDEDEPNSGTSEEATPLLPKSVKAKLSKSIQEFMAMSVLCFCCVSLVVYSDSAGSCTSRGSSLNYKVF
jgi:hypothetical protein